MLCYESVLPIPRIVPTRFETETVSRFSLPELGQRQTLTTLSKDDIVASPLGIIRPTQIVKMHILPHSVLTTHPPATYEQLMLNIMVTLMQKEWSGTEGEEWQKKAMQLAAVLDKVHGLWKDRVGFGFRNEATRSIGSYILGGLRRQLANQGTQFVEENLEVFRDTAKHWSDCERVSDDDLKQAFKQIIDSPANVLMAFRLFEVTFDCHLWVPLWDAEQCSYVLWVVPYSEHQLECILSYHAKRLHKYTRIVEEQEVKSRLAEWRQYLMTKFMGIELNFPEPVFRTSLTRWAESVVNTLDKRCPEVIYIESTRRSPMLKRFLDEDRQRQATAEPPAKRLRP
eukprot:5707184-Amphidinium_carterae.1